MKTSRILLLLFLFVFNSCSKEIAEIQEEELTTIDFVQQMAPTSSTYNLEQAMSDNGQLMTIAFNGLAFMTGNDGADTFFPPGKVADYFGFQYMRDIDVAGYGHNTQFLSRAANNVIDILNTEQLAKLVSLAKEQAPIYVKFAYNRFPLMDAFRRNLTGDTPEGSIGLSRERITAYTANLYEIDADLSYNRAVMMGELAQSLTTEQKEYFANMTFNDFNTWPDIAEDHELKRSMTNTEFVAVMTYASEFFSWYKGGLNADIYFCPERHGTYFGGFFLKDYPAMNNPDYFIPLNQTGEDGKAFLNTLTSEQEALMNLIIPEQKALLEELAQVREDICLEMRKALNGDAIDRALVYHLIERYGELDGSMSGLYAIQFGAIYKTLTDAQKETLQAIRNLDVVPDGAYRYASPTAMPIVPNTDYLFGIGDIPADAGSYAAPADFYN